MDKKMDFSVKSYLENLMQKVNYSNYFAGDKESYCCIANALSNSLEDIEFKKQYIPKSLYKFYKPTVHNIIDFEESQLHFADPALFNDPYDCRMFSNKHDYIINEMSKLSGVSEKISKTELERSISNYSPLGDVTKKIIPLLMLNKDEEGILHKALIAVEDEYDKKLKCLNDKRDNVACFSNLTDDEFSRNIVMWAHYAENNKGFCVKYNFNKLISSKTCRNSGESVESVNDRINTLLIARLFPIVYTNELEFILPAEFLFLDNNHNGDYIFDKEVYKFVIESELKKQNQWEYEKEWRILMSKNVVGKNENRLPFDFAETLYLGMNIDRHIENYLTRIAKRKNIRVCKMQISHNDCKLVSKDISDFSLKDFYFNLALNQH